MKPVQFLLNAKSICLTFLDQGGKMISRASILSFLTIRILTMDQRGLCQLLSVSILVISWGVMDVPWNRLWSELLLSSGPILSAWHQCLVPVSSSPWESGNLLSTVCSSLGKHLSVSGGMYWGALTAHHLQWHWGFFLKGPGCRLSWCSRCEITLRRQLMSAFAY